MGFAEEMAGYDEQWAEAQAKGPGVLPDGPYQAYVVESRVEQDTDGVWTWYNKFQDVSGKGSVRKWQRLNNDTGREFAARDAKVMGYEGALSGLEAWCMTEAPLGLIVEIKVVTKAGTGDRDFTNVYVNKCIGRGTPPASGESTGPVGSDDDIPF